MTKTVGSQTDVPTPGDPIISPWHQDTASKLFHRFATKTTLDGWSDAPNGAQAWTITPPMTWARIGGAWSAVGFLRGQTAVPMDAGGYGIVTVGADLGHKVIGMATMGDAGGSGMTVNSLFNHAGTTNVQFVIRVYNPDGSAWTGGGAWLIHWIAW